MKTKLFFSIVIFLQLILISCNEKLDEINVTSNNKGDKLLSFSNPYDSAGIIHNEILENHYTSMLPHNSSHLSNVITFNNENYFKVVQIDTFLINFSNYALSKGMNSSDINNIKNQVFGFFSNAQMFTTINNTFVMKDISTNIYNLINAAMTYGNLSQNEYNVLSNLINCLYTKNYANVDSLVNSINLNNYSFSEYPAVYAFKAVYEHSLEYWTDYVESLKTSKTSKNDEIQFTAVPNMYQFGMAVADAIGGAAGAALVAGTSGFFPNVIIGLAASAATYAYSAALSNPPCTCPVCQYYGMCE